MEAGRTVGAMIAEDLNEHMIARVNCGFHTKFGANHRLQEIKLRLHYLEYHQVLEPRQGGMMDSASLKVSLCTCPTHTRLTADGA